MRRGKRRKDACFGSGLTVQDGRAGNDTYGRRHESCMFVLLLRRSPMRTSRAVWLLCQGVIAVAACGLHAEQPLRLLVTTAENPEAIFSRTAHGLVITNPHRYSVTIQSSVWVEWLSPSGWKEQTAIAAVNNCKTFSPFLRTLPPIRIEAYGTFFVVPWTGYFCGGQCPMGCRQNALATPGMYRYVVVLVPGGERIASPAFRIE